MTVQDLINSYEEKLNRLCAEYKRRHGQMSERETSEISTTIINYEGFINNLKFILTTNK